LLEIDGRHGLHLHRVVQRVLRDNYWPVLLDKTKHEISVLGLLKKPVTEMAMAFEPHFNENLQSQSFALIRAYQPQVNNWLGFAEKDFHAGTKPAGFSLQPLLYPLKANLALAYTLLENWHWPAALLSAVDTVQKSSQAAGDFSYQPIRHAVD
jgi:hypothetical protein